jgi:PAS domain S-box-containing protein
MDDSEIYDQMSQLNNELVNTQRDLVKTNKNLEYQIERFKVTLQNIADPVIVTDENFIITLVNQKAFSFIGNNQDIINKPIDEVLQFKETTSNSENGVFTLSQQESIFPLHHKELLLFSYSQEPFFVELSISAIEEKSGITSGYVVVIHSIAERKKIEIQQTEIKDILQVINRILRHDILNHLNVIQMATYLSEKKGDFTYLSKVMKSVEASIKLVNDMKNLEYTVSKGGKLAVYETREIIEEVSSNYPIQFNISGYGKIVADEAFSSVIDNLIRNAINHGKTEKMDIVISPNKDYSEISIRDYGAGMKKDILDKIFDENFKAGSTGNTGIGLYIVKKVIERYGGNIRVESELGKGTTFTLKVPSQN